MNPTLESALINLGCGVALLIAWPWLRRSKKRLALRGELRAQERRDHTIRSAAGIKGDGFSALFHLHRALHTRIKVLSCEVCAVGLYIVSAIYNGQAWWMGLPFQVAAVVLFFCGVRLAVRADAMTDIAEEAAKRDGGEEAVTAVVKEQD